jgi:hypothetical protein
MNADEGCRAGASLRDAEAGLSRQRTSFGSASQQTVTRSALPRGPLRGKVCHVLDQGPWNPPDFCAGVQAPQLPLPVRGLCDPASTGTPDPWLWIGSTTDQSIRRRSPTNVAAVPGLFDGPGGFSAPGASLETFLANDVERPAATPPRRLLQSTSIEQLPPEVMRYLAWAASRSLPMQRPRGRLGYALSSDAEPPDGGTATACFGRSAATTPIDSVDSPRARRAPRGPKSRCGRAR